MDKKEKVEAKPKSPRKTPKSPKKSAQPASSSAAPPPEPPVADLMGLDLLCFDAPPAMPPAPAAMEPAPGVNVVLVTGVTRGLGEAMTRWIITKMPGSVVVGCGQDATAITRMSQEFPQCNFSLVDLTDEHQVASWATSVVPQFGVPHMVINNASSINQKQQLWEVNGTEFSKVMNVNVKGVQHVIRHFVSLMVELKRGVIVNMSSNWGRTVSAMVGPYCTSKWAIEVRIAHPSVRPHAFSIRVHCTSIRASERPSSVFLSSGPNQIAGVGIGCDP
jgi:NADP-dependent 3-hydroxy acid dehydrogenase YdfG